MLDILILPLSRNLIKGHVQNSTNSTSGHPIAHSLSRVVVPTTLHSISVNAHFTRFLKNLETVKKNVLKIVLIIVNINNDENKSLISNQFSLKNDFPPTSWRTILQR